MAQMSWPNNQWKPNPTFIWRVIFLLIGPSPRIKREHEHAVATATLPVCSESNDYHICAFNAPDYINRSYNYEYSIKNATSYLKLKFLLNILCQVL